MKKIVIDARRLRQTTGRYHRELLTQLEKLDTENEYHVLIHTKDQGVWIPTNSNFFMHVVTWDYYTLGEQLGLARYIQKLKPDLVHFIMPQQPLLYFGKRITGILDLTLLKFDNIDKNRFIYKIEKFIFRLMLRNVAKRSKRILTISNFVKKDILSFVKVPSSKIVVAKPAAVEHAKVNPVAIHKLKGTQFIFFVGNAFPHKNLERLIQSFELLRKKHPKLHLAIAGKKDFFHEQLESSYSSVKNLHFLGYIEEEELAWMYDHAKAYVFPSLNEGFGLPGLEAMQHGVPVVSSNASCLPEIYGDAAHYFDPLSTDAMAASIDEVLRSKTRRDELVKAGHVQVKKFSWEKMAKKIHTQYLEVLD